MKFIRAGKECVVPVSEILMIVAPASAPIKRILEDAKKNKTNIDTTCGKKTRSILIMKNGAVIQSSVTIETLVKKANSGSGQSEA